MIEVIKISEQFFRITNKEYEILDKWETSPNPNDFSLNNFYSSSGNGDGRISLGKDYNNFKSFFDIEEDVTSNRQDTILELGEKKFIILKEDLKKYIIEAKYKFKYPLNKDIYFGGNVEKNYNNAKIKIKDDFEFLKNDFENFYETYEFKMDCILDPYGELWIRHENAHQSEYKLIRKMAIPTYSFFHILKLKNNEEIIYYMKLCFSDNKIMPERLKDNLKDLIIPDDTIKQLCASLNAGQNIILTGVPGTGKTHLATIYAKEVMGDEGYVLTTATSDWTTFDTIGGLIPKDEGKLEFREGKFLQSIKENKWLIIDEINRADIDKAFGQLFTVLSGQDVELPYYIKSENDKLIPIKIKSSDDYDSFYDENNATYFIGKNWRIIATMNSYDKNALFDLSYAFMRRFMIINVDVPESLNDFINKLKNEDDEILFDKFCQEFKNKLINLYTINTEHTDIDRKLGPAIFLDILKYIYSRMYFEVDKCLDEDGKFKYNNDIFSEALISYIIPQFEGLNPTQRKSAKSFLKKTVFIGENSDLVIKKLDDMKSFYG